MNDEEMEAITTRKADEDGVLDLEDLPVKSRMQRRRGKIRSVTDFAQLNWCQQQTHYQHFPPLQAISDYNADVQARNAARVAAGSSQPPQPLLTILPTSAKSQVKAGAVIHQQRELEIATPVVVKIASREDSWALKLINLHSAALLLQTEGVAREVPVFGVPFPLHSFPHPPIFLSGVVDELRLQPDSWTLTLSDLKTRQKQYKPSETQLRQSRLQVLMYGHIWEQLTTSDAATQLEQLCSHAALDPDASLGAEVAKESGSMLVEGQPVTLRGLFSSLDLSVLPRRPTLEVEYIHQETRESLGTYGVDWSGDQLRSEWESFLSFWREVPSPSPSGVPPSEAWKCHNCDYNEICEWRKAKIQELITANNSRR